MGTEQRLGDITGSILKDVNVNSIESSLNLIKEQSVRIDKLESELDKKQSKSKYRFHWFLFGIVIIILLAILGSQIPKMDFESNYVALVLGFIGVLTTFIVVGNYAQVKEIEKTFEKETKKIKMGFEIKIQEIEDKNKDIISKTKNLQVGLCMNYADLYKSNSQDSSFYYWLKAICVALDNIIDEEDNIKKCVYEIKLLNKGKSVYEIGAGQCNTMLNGTPLGEILYEIKTHKNYSQANKGLHDLFSVNN
jgi:hypothetical protein